MSARHFSLSASVLAASAFALPATGPVRAQTASETAGPPMALVVSNSSYTALPPLPTCQLSANLVAAVLTRAGFKVTRQSDLSNARLGTAIANLGENAAAAPGSRAVVYICTYAVSYSGRLFVLPVEARLANDSDVLSQGIVGRLLMSSADGPASAAGLVVMDVAVPAGKGPLDFASMTRASDSAHGGLIAAALPATDAPGPAPLASALSESVGDGKLEIGQLLATLSAKPEVKRSLLVARAPTDPSWLIGAPAPPAAPPPQAAAASPPAVIAAPPPPSPPAVAAAPPPASAPAVVAPPTPVSPSAAAPDAAADQAALADPNPADRRRLQLALSRLGYYRGRIDGTFALETALAIRQYQRESNAEPTGRLTVKQMEQLLR